MLSSMDSGPVQDEAFFSQTGALTGVLRINIDLGGAGVGHVSSFLSRGFFFADTGIEVIFRQRSGSLWAGQVGGNFPIVWLAPGGGNLSCVPLAMKGLPET